MTCTCSCLSPFRWREHGEPSIFADDPAFRVRDAAGRSMSQITSANIEAFERKNGYSLGTVGGISAKASRDAEERNHARHARKVAARA